MLSCVEYADKFEVHVLLNFVCTIMFSLCAQRGGLQTRRSYHLLIYSSELYPPSCQC